MYKRSASMSDWKAFSQMTTGQPCGNKRPNFSSVFANSKSKTNSMRNMNYSHTAKNLSNAEEYDYYNASDIQKRLGIGRTKAYELINELNKKLEANGKIVLSGRIPKSFFNEQLY